MAKGPKYWYDIMIAEKNTKATLLTYQPNIDSAQTFLDQMATNSKVAAWRCVFWVIACAYYAFELVLDAYALYLESIAAKSQYGTLPWYVKIAKEYQHGDALVKIDSEWRYATVNPAAQIVTNAASADGTGIVNIKIAKTVAGVLQPLSGPEEAGFTAYMNKRKPAGPNVHVINEAPDDLRLYLAINYDPLVLKANGELISTPGVFPAEVAVSDYKNNLDFDGSFELMKAIDAIQNAKGIVSAYVISASARYGTNPFVVFDQRYLPNAGYLVIDAGNPLSATITYTPNA